MAEKMRSVSKGLRWQYRNVSGKRSVVGKDRLTGEVIIQGESMVDYQSASIQGIVDKVFDRPEGSNNSNVKPFPLYFKAKPSWPLWNNKMVPPVNPVLRAVADEVLEDDQKEPVKDWDWSSKTPNIGGARELLFKGPAIPPFLTGEKFQLLEENDDPIDEEVWDNFFEKPEAVFVQGVLASHCKNSMDDKGNVALFKIPKLITDPGLLDQLSLIQPSDGKSHDNNMNPAAGSNKSANRKEISHTTAQYLYDILMKFKRHYERWVQKNGKPTLEECSLLIQESMKDVNEPTAMFTTYNGFPKLEPMTVEKIVMAAACRLIWGPGNIESILGKILLKNVTLSSFKRYDRGNAHGVEASNGGFTRMFQVMMGNIRDKKSFFKFLKENGYDGDEFDFDAKLAEFGWRDDDLKKWDLMQFQVYMLLNLQYFILSYDWSTTLDVDQAGWLFLFVALATIDTTVVSDLGFGPELFVRILASGLFLTASGGSKSHDMMSHAFSFRQTWVAHRTWNQIKRLHSVGDPIRAMFKKSFRAFKLGSPFVHFSDDFLQTCLRRGLPFGQLVNRASFFSKMFGLEFKIADRPWKSIVGEDACKKMFELLPTFDYVIKRYPDLLEKEKRKEPMDGITTEFTLYPFLDRCTQWYPLTSETYKKEHGKEGLMIHGVNFLKFHFVAFEDEAESSIYIIPVRDHYEMYHKLYYSRVSYKNPAQMLIKLRSYAYYSSQWPRTYNTFKRIHDIIKQRYCPNMEQIKQDDLLRSEVPRKLGLSLEEIMADFPDVTTVNKFFMPSKVRAVERMTDLRDKVLWSPYRSLDYVMWDLIRRKDVTRNIAGLYGNKEGDFRIQQDVMTRTKLGLEVARRERAKPPPRRANP